MKLRESGMPAEDYWESLLDADAILARFRFDAATGDVAELGCGYGTFTLPLARRIGGSVRAFDIDADMVERVRVRAVLGRIANISATQRDVLTLGYELPEASCDAALLFNILHGESPVELLRETAKIIRHGGMLAVIHWRTDIPTPRGPSADIRPSAEKIITWATAAGDLCLTEGPFELPPYHYGLAFVRNNPIGALSLPHDVGFGRGIRLVHDATGVSGTVTTLDSARPRRRQR